MFAFDTNHLLRHILQDDEKQCREVSRLVQASLEAETPIHLLDLVLMETCWVLESVYQTSREDWCRILTALLEDPLFRFDNPTRLWKALERYRQGKADFDDYLIWGQAESLGAELKTFDKKLRKEIV
jgi:predicted nucleic-acid-binding protein